MVDAISDGDAHRVVVLAGRGWVGLVGLDVPEAFEIPDL